MGTVKDVSLKDFPDTADNDSWSQLKTLEIQTTFDVPVGCIEHFYTVLCLTTVVIGIGSSLYCHILSKVNI